MPKWKSQESHLPAQDAKGKSFKPLCISTPIEKDQYFLSPFF